MKIKKKTVAQIIFEAIKVRDIDYVFCVPGESFLATINSFFGEVKPCLISTRHEEGAGIMAEVYAKSSGKIGVCMVTRGPGLTHLSVALHTARQDSTPLVVFVGQVPTSVRYRESFQEIDIVEFVRPVSKWAAEVSRADRVLEIVEKAFHISNSGRPGPVVISLPEDIDRSNYSGDFKLRDSIFNEPFASISSIEKASEIIINSIKPCLLVGEGVLKGNYFQKIIQFADYIEAPVFTAWRRFDAFPNNHRLYMGGLHPSSISSELYKPIKKADLLIVLGTRLDEFTTMNYSYPSKNQRVIHIDQSPEETGGSWAGADLAITGNLGDAVESIRNRLKTLQFPRPLKTRINELKIWKQNYLLKTTPRINGKGLLNGQIDLEKIFYEIINNLEDETSITCDAGDFGSWLIRYYKWNKPNTFYGPTSGAMGYALPAAISAKLARPKYPAIAFAGDGGFAMTMSEMETAVRLKLESLVVIVFNNASFGTISRHQKREFPGREFSMDLSEIDFSKIAQAMGAIGFRIDKNEDFLDAFRKCLKSNCPSLIDIKIEGDNINAWD
tara:strand:+ start:3725 stop:5392 length:1668 start_codon:yes stop_codon:yes gene_type:complete